MTCSETQPPAPNQEHSRSRMPVVAPCPFKPGQPLRTLAQAQGIIRALNPGERLHIPGKRASQERVTLTRLDTDVLEYRWGKGDAAETFCNRGEAGVRDFTRLLYHLRKYVRSAVLEVPAPACSVNAEQRISGEGSCALAGRSTCDPFTSAAHTRPGGKL